MRKESTGCKYCGCDWCLYNSWGLVQNNIKAGTFWSNQSSASSMEHLLDLILVSYRCIISKNLIMIDLINSFLFVFCWRTAIQIILLRVSLRWCMENWRIWMNQYICWNEWLNDSWRQLFSFWMSKWVLTSHLSDALVKVLTCQQLSWNWISV